jgi:methyl-accepting chemotaxis protein
MLEIAHYLGIDERTQRFGELAWRIVDADMERVLERFYTRTRERDSGVALDHETITRLKVKQKEHWKALFEGEFDEAFFRRASMIGLRHHEIGLSASWYIAGYSIIKLELIRLVMKAPFALAIQIELVLTLERYVALDMACALSSYSAWIVD